MKENSVNGVFALRDLLVLAFYHRLLIGACLAFGLIVGCIAAIATPSYYSAESLLLLRPEAQNGASSSVNATLSLLPADFVQRMITSDVAIVESAPVLRAVVSSGAHPPPAGDDRAMERAIKKIREQLTVAAEPGSNIIRVTYKDPDRETAIKTVSALVKAYAEQRASVYESSAGDLQQRELQRYTSQLRDIGEQIEKTKSEAGVLDIGQDIELASARLDSLIASGAQAQQQQAAIEAQLKAASAEFARTPPVVLESQEDSNARPNDEIVNTLARLRQERQHVVEQYTESWPGLRTLDARIAAAVEQQRAGQQAMSQTVRKTRNPVVDQIGRKASELRIDLQAARSQVAQIDQAIADTHDRITRLRTADARLHDLQRARELMEGEYKQLSLGVVDARLRGQLLGDRNGSMHVLQPASAPARPVRRWPLLVIGGLALGTIAAVVACTAATLARQEFITPEEAARSLGLPVIAEVPDPAVSDAGFRAEAALLAELIAETTIDGRPLKSVRVVATGWEDGKLLALALAQALAAPGQTAALLVDLTREGPLRSASNGEVRRLGEPDSEFVLAQTQAQRVWTAVSGHTEGASALSSFFETVAADFDHVVVFGDDDSQGQKKTRRAYRLVDANLLVVRASDSRAPVLRHLRETILDAGGDLLGMAFLGRRFYIPQRIYRWL